MRASHQIVAGVHHVADGDRELFELVLGITAASALFRDAAVSLVAHSLVLTLGHACGGCPCSLTHPHWRPDPVVLCPRSQDRLEAHELASRQKSKAGSGGET